MTEKTSSFKDNMGAAYDKNKDIVNAGESTEWYKFKEGKNVLHVLAEPQFLAELYKVGICYPGCGYRGNAKFLTYVLVDGKIYKMKFPVKVANAIAELESSERFSFTGFPMPYRVEVGAKGAGTKEVEYTVLPGADREIPKEILEQLADLDSPADIIKKMQDSQKKKVESGEVKLPNAEQEPGYAESIDDIEIHEVEEDRVPL